MQSKQKETTEINFQIGQTNQSIETVTLEKAIRLLHAAAFLRIPLQKDLANDLNITPEYLCAVFKKVECCYAWRLQRHSGTDYRRNADGHGLTVTVKRCCDWRFFSIITQ